MTPKKQKSMRRKPDLTIEADNLTVFKDKPRGGVTETSRGVVTTFDPDLAARRREYLQGRGREFGLNRKLTEARPSDEKHIKSLAKILEDCLRTAGSIKSKRGTELVKLLRDARRKVELIET